MSGLSSADVDSDWVPLAGTSALAPPSWLDRWRPRIEMTREGLQVFRPFRDVQRFRWDEIAWICMREISYFPPDPPEIETEPSSLAVTLMRRTGQRIEVRFSATYDATLGAFLSNVSSELSRRMFEDARRRLNEGDEIDFGVVRLSQHCLRVQSGRSWQELPFAPWRSAASEPAAKPALVSFRLAGLELRNPELFCSLLRTILPDTHFDVVRAWWGGVSWLSVPEPSEAGK